MRYGLKIWGRVWHLSAKSERFLRCEDLGGRTIGQRHHTAADFVDFVVIGNDADLHVGRGMPKHIGAYRLAIAVVHGPAGHRILQVAITPVVAHRQPGRTD